jgi:hypothetical protein
VKNVRLPGASTSASTVQVRFEMFNAFNWVNLLNPEGRVNRADFGRVVRARDNGDVVGPRVIQLGLKFTF